MTSLTLNYDSIEDDRLLVALDAGKPDSCGFWLTRRLVLNLIHVANPYLEKLSPVVAKTPTELRPELAAMERQVALAVTEQAMGRTPTEALNDPRSRADLAYEVTLSHRQDVISIVFRPMQGGERAFTCNRPELQRVIHMFELEAVKAGWHEASRQEPPTEPEKSPRRAN